MTSDEVSPEAFYDLIRFEARAKEWTRIIERLRDVPGAEGAVSIVEDEGPGGEGARRG